MANVTHPTINSSHARKLSGSNKWATSVLKTLVEGLDVEENNFRWLPFYRFREHISRITEGQGSDVSKAKEGLVFDALKDPTWAFRTIDGIAENTEMPEHEVRFIIEAHPEAIRRSSVLHSNGSELFAERSKPVSMRERLATLRMFITNSLQ